MYLLNNRMFLLLEKKKDKSFRLNNKLLKILNGGFSNIDGCWFFAKMYEKQIHIKRNDFDDRTGYECFINSFHVDDLVKRNCLGQTILFAHRLLKMWSKLDNNLKIIIIIGETNYGFNFRFHIYRSNEKWIDETKMQNIKEGILIIKN